MSQGTSRWRVLCSCGWERECSSAWAAQSVSRLHPDGEHERHLYETRLIDQYELDWSVVRATQNTDRRIELRLPNVRLRAGGIAVANVLVRTPKRVGAGGGAMVQELMMLSEILAIQESGIVFLVGFQRAPALPLPNPPQPAA